MKNKRRLAFKCACFMAAAFMSSSCNDFLDKLPLDAVTPELYFTTEADLASYAINMYGLFPRHEGWGLGTIMRGDDNTDNQATTNASYERWVIGNKRVPQSGGGWDFGNIRSINYFFEQCLPKREAGQIQGSEKNIDQYIGEMYFIRAYEYFNKLKTYGDFPILTNTLPDDLEALTEASKRRPRNEVARFILEDIDRSIKLMTNTPVGKKNRLTSNAALLFKSRVALYEATWLKYHKGTARVPGGGGWPGASKEYNTGFSIDIDAEIDFFLTQAMDASRQVADAVTLTRNTGVANPDGAFNGWNPYFDMFNASSMEDFEEVLFWKAYSTAQNVNHAVSYYILGGGGNTGFTKSYVDSYLMQNGLPIYATNSGYEGENTIEDAKKSRDSRLQLFVVAPSDLRVVNTEDPNASFGNPPILEQPETRSVTGYRPRKCLTYDPSQNISSGVSQAYGCIVFRAVEAYLNYIEASYEKNGRLDATAEQYWKAIRQRANISDDIAATIAATELDKEGDWAKYSKTTLVDATLFNIRRERRNEFISENFRFDDLKRWCSLDMVRNYHVEGFNLWESSYANEYVDESGNSLFIEEGVSDQQANVSNRTNSKYLRPNQIIRINNDVYNGYNWHTANYLEPIAYQHFLITAGSSGNVDASPIYQNPQWPVTPNLPAID
ncbi:MAG: RagB/SusD family nutrient uptake outer membrane protein [Phocaeicola sp.]